MKQYHSDLEINKQIKKMPKWKREQELKILKEIEIENILKVEDYK